MPEDSKNKDIELRSEKVRNIVGKIPPLIIRGGITFVTLLMFALLLAAWFIPYPENLNISFSVSSQTGTNWQATAYLPYSHVTQVKEGMILHAELEGYNPRMYGYADGTIINVDKNIVKQNDRNCFTVTLQLNVSETKIEMKEQMRGEAFILLSNESIMERIFRSILGIEKKS